MVDTAMILEQPYITITNIIWSFDRQTGQLQVLLVQRAGEPETGRWALPETFMRANESADEAALRLIKEKIGLKLAAFHTEQLATFTDQRRSEGARALSLAYMTFLPEMPPLQAGYGALAAQWFAVTAQPTHFQLHHGALEFATAAVLNTENYYQQLRLPETMAHLAFDHEWIMAVACSRIKNKLDYQPNILLVLGDSFTLKEARTVYAALLGIDVHAIDNSNFKKTHQHLFVEVGTVSQRTIGRPAKLFRLARVQD
ncbi:NUDIX hydrolase [Lapidilactobacillus luobeiensis]|uniref:NUDIX hydrolase n=1 Tax=Lapidilactobacillus luobeiensis TaxID=2950371 RepID=UPI0021C272CA|nr:NUDIX domain-containing protein [Lapidilactobacillus luobeiensis]